MKLEQALQKVYRDNIRIIEDPTALAETALEFQQIMMMYEAGIKQITTKLEILNCEFHTRSNRNPIETVKSRIKEPKSIVEKMHKRGYPITLKAMTENIQDIAGVRITCPFISDIYEVASMLTSQDDIFLLSLKDYIKHPKDNGYRSLHLVVRTPVFFSDRKEDIVVEIQIRTIAMDFWASLEHQMKYKQDIKNPQLIVRELKRCADELASCDVSMQTIRNLIHAQE